jgi:Protein of unknown function (DUF5672)
MYTAIIIEPRKHKALYFVLHNVLDCLPSEWKIVFFHGTLNLEYSTPIVNELNNLYENRIQMVSLNVDNLTLMEYSKLLATKSMIYDYIPTEYFLVFQTDSMIFKKNIHLLDQFIHSDYDYIGSPWLRIDYFRTRECDYIGNGGFSLRKKSKMFEIMDKVPWNDKYEDLYFAHHYKDIEIKKPPYEIAMQFCFDEAFHPIALAAHKPWFRDHTPVSYEIVRKTYPECDILKNLQGVEL